MSIGNKYKYDLDIFYREDALSYYLLGAWMTDGHIWAADNRILPSLTSCDLDWLEKIRNFICPDLKILKVNNTNCHALQIYSSELGKWFIEKGCTPKKSLTLKMPFVPEIYFPDFLRGCIDGDGSLGIYKYDRFFPKKNASYVCTVSRIKLTSGSKSFIENIKSKIDGLKFNNYIEIVKAKPPTIPNEYYHLCVWGRQTGRLANYLYYKNNPLSMPRKAKIAQEMIDKFGTVIK